MKVRLARIEDWDFIKTNADQVYSKIEKEFWKKNYYRISKNECLNLIKEKKLYVLSNLNEILGFVTITKINSKTLTFSMLTVIEKYHHRGYGNILITYVIDKAYSEKVETIFIEILCAKKWKHDQKEVLIKWYKKNGFKYLKSFSFESLYPSHKKFMKCELIFKQFTKKLSYNN
jgi:N-acetylglutamate synthase-like GNAT family acetyltransferase